MLTDFLGALGTGDRTRAFGVVRGLRSEGVDVLTIVTELLAPAQRRVGELWVRDAWSVAQEHAATAISEAALHSLAVERDRELRAGDSPDAPLVIVSCVEQEGHALPALIVAEHLRGAGYAVSYLGANASAQHLVRHIHELGPRAVLLSCSISAFLPLARRQVEAVRETGTPVVVGGSAFDAAGKRAQALGATAFAGSGPEAARLIGELPNAVSAAEPLVHPGAEEAYLVFGDREALADEVERLLLTSLAAARVPPVADEGRSWLRVLDDQMPHLVGAMAGALVTGDRQVAADALNWAEVVLLHRGAPPEVGPALRIALHRALHDVPVAAGMLAALQSA
ncbi:MAG: cobalamin B12-binding domain-containing protein [Nocardioidaceae bacterium]